MLVVLYSIIMIKLIYLLVVYTLVASQRHWRQLQLPPLPLSFPCCPLKHSNKNLHNLHRGVFCKGEHAFVPLALSRSIWPAFIRKTLVCLLQDLMMRKCLDPNPPPLPLRTGLCNKLHTRSLFLLYQLH